MIRAATDVGQVPRLSEWDKRPACPSPTTGEVLIQPLAAAPLMRIFTKPRAATDGGVITLEETQTEQAHEVPWNVVVHNDPINLMDYVTKVLMRIFGYAKKKAEIHMTEVHRNGRSIVWTGERERAEFYVQQLHGYLLLATIEKSR